MNLFEFAISAAGERERSGRFSTAHLYRAAIRSLARCIGTRRIAFSAITPVLLARYEQWLRARGCRPNTISTYMRMLRSLLNQAARRRLTKPRAGLFLGVFTGVEASHSRAIDAPALRKILFAPVTDERLLRAQQTARLQYLLCGMPMADLARLSPHNLRGDILDYRRQKTGVRICFRIDGPTAALLREWGERNGASPQAFASRASWQRHQHRLARYNQHLRLLAAAVGLPSGLRVSSYSLRHGWAQVSKRAGLPVEQISELLGHRNIATTQIYLRRFNEDELARSIRRNLAFLAQA